MPTNFLHQTEIEATDQKWADIYKNMQGNILKGHGRDHATMIFISFIDGKEGPTKAALTEFSKEHVTSFYTQLWERERYKRNKTSGNTFGSLFITQKGYKYLESEVKLNEPSFDAGMSKSAFKLADDLEIVEPEYSQNENETHAMILLADDDKTRMDKLVIQLLSKTWKKAEEDIFKIIHIEYGDAIRNANGDGLEHNGYVDGISQPLFLKDEVDEYRKQHGIKGNKFEFDPRAKPSLVLVKDPYAAGTDAAISFGSYFVFRKLEQDVKSFKKEEEDIGDAIYKEEEDKEKVGAILVGRFEDGTPIKVQGQDKLIGSGAFNNFNYAKKTPYDPSDGRCPHFAHIRKTNPRISGKFDTHTMARRGIPYGHRNVNTAIEDIQSHQFPSAGVGLLFMSYQKSLVNQFEFIQRKANEKKDGGVDPIIGQNANRPKYLFPKDDGQNPKPPLSQDFHQHIHFKGGEYFFAPSISYLDKLASQEEGS